MATKQLSKQMLQRELAVYKGDEFIAMDTIENLAKLFNTAPENVYYWSTPSNFRRAKNRVDFTVAVRVDDEEETEDMENGRSNI